MEVGQQEEVVGVVAPMPVETPLEVQVVPPADNPQSPSPSPPTLRLGTSLHLWAFIPRML